MTKPTKFVMKDRLTKEQRNFVDNWYKFRVKQTGRQLERAVERKKFAYKRLPPDFSQEEIDRQFREAMKLQEQNRDYDNHKISQEIESIISQTNPLANKDKQS